MLPRKAGQNGKVIGVDMTEEMIEKARANAEKYRYTGFHVVFLSEDKEISKRQYNGMQLESIQIEAFE